MGEGEIMSETAAKKKVLSFDEFLAVDDTRFIEVPIDGAILRLGSLNAGDLLEWAEANDGEAKRTAGLRLIVRSIVNENGERTGTDKHLNALRKKDAKTCNDLVSKILELNGLNAKQQEEVKNASGGVGSDASPTVLH